MVAPIWALILVHALIIGSLAALAEAAPPKRPVRIAMANQVVSDSLPCPARPKTASPLRSGKRPTVFLWIARSDTPNGDDGTSRDPDDDDDTSKDLNGDDDSDVPILSWPQEIVLYLIDLEAESLPTWGEIPYSPFPALQPLRC